MRQIITKLAFVSAIALTAAGAQERVKIDRDYFYTAHHLTLTATVTNGNAAPTGPKLGGAMNLISEFTVAINDKIKPRDKLSGLDLLQDSIDATGQVPFGFAPIDTAADAVTKVEIVIPIIYGFPNVMQQFTTALDLTRDGADADLIRKAEMVIKAGGVDALFVNPNGATVSDIKVTVESETLDLSAKTTPHVRAPLRYVEAVTAEIESGNHRDVFLEPVNDWTYSGVTLTALKNGEATSLAGESLNISHGQEDIFENISLTALRARASRLRDYQYGPETVRIDLVSRHDLSLALSGAAMREDVKIRFKPEFTALGENSVRVMMESFRNWNFT